MNSEDSAQIILTEQKKVFSRDEMNLAEFPLTVLSTRVNSNHKTLEFTDTVHSRNGEPLKRHWIVTGADKFGLPTASDDEVLLGLLKLTVQSGFHDRKVYFTRYELLKILRWTTEGRSYQRLQNAFDRLSGVRIKATNAFFDNETKAHSTRNFGIVDAYEINHAGESHAKPSFFIWSEVLFKSFQVGFIKKLDLDFYLALKSAVSKRLYRYLDKHFWYKSKLQTNLFALAHEKIGISRNYKFASSLRQQLDPAIQELLQVKFISACEFIGKGSETEVVFYAANKTPRSLSRAKPDAENYAAQSEGEKPTRNSYPAQLDNIQAALTARGIKSNQALRLLERRTTEELRRIEQIIEHFDALVNTGSKLVSRSPVGFLYRAVERPENFVLPNESPRGQAQTSLGFMGARPAAVSPKKNGVQSEKQSAYLVARKREVERLLGNVEPEVLGKMRREVEEKLIRLKGLISDEGFEDAVQHGIEEKLLKLFAFPDFAGWSGLGQ